MSWSATIGTVAPDEFDAAVDEATVEPAEDGLADEPREQLEAARAAVKELGVEVSKDAGDKLMTATMSGHACVEGEDGIDSVTVTVRQVAV